MQSWRAWRFERSPRMRGQRSAALLEKEGVAWDWPDLAIASVALVEHMTVVSNDRFFRHVERVCGLRFERWEP